MRLDVALSQATIPLRVRSDARSAAATRDSRTIATDSHTRRVSSVVVVE